MNIIKTERERERERKRVNSEGRTHSKHKPTIPPCSSLFNLTEHKKGKNCVEDVRIKKKEDA